MYDLWWPGIGQVVGYLTLTGVVPNTQISPREGVSILLDLFCLVTFPCDLSLGASPLSPALWTRWRFQFLRLVEFLQRVMLLLLISGSGVKNRLSFRYVITLYQFWRHTMTVLFLGGGGRGALRFYVVIYLVAFFIFCLCYPTFLSKSEKKVGLWEHDAALCTSLFRPLIDVHELYPIASFFKL